MCAEVFFISRLQSQAIALKRIPEVFSLVFNVSNFISGAMFLEIWKWSWGLDTQRWVSEQYWKWSSLAGATGILRRRKTHRQWNDVYMKTPTPTLQSRVALGSFAGPFATGRLRGCAGAKCCRPAREIAFLQQEEKKNKTQKPTSEGNTELKISREVETMPELVLHLWKPLQMYWNL